MKRMKKIKVLFLCLLALILTGCGNIDSSENNKDLLGYKLDYNVSSEDGQNIYQVNGCEYPFLIRLTGRSENAKYDSYYMILTNDADLSFEDVDVEFWGSYSSLTKDFVIVEYGLINE